MLIRKTFFRLKCTVLTIREKRETYRKRRATANSKSEKSVKTSATAGPRCFRYYQACQTLLGKGGGLESEVNGHTYQSCLPSALLSDEVV